jgi:hypothetical protein
MKLIGVHRMNLHHILGFSEADFKPAYANQLIAQATQLFHVHPKEFYIKRLLQDNATAGSRTGIVWLFGNSGETFHHVLHHATTRPFGNATPITCLHCGIFKPYDRAQFQPGGKKLKLSCKVCN